MNEFQWELKRLAAEKLRRNERWGNVMIELELSFPGVDPEDFGWELVEAQLVEDGVL